VKCVRLTSLTVIITSQCICVVYKNMLQTLNNFHQLCLNKAKKRKTHGRVCFFCLTESHHI
jgi:hypothetical protein